MSPRGAVLRTFTFLVEMVLTAGMQLRASQIPKSSIIKPNTAQVPLTLSAQKSLRRAAGRASEPRNVCSRCARPPLVCVCSALPFEPLETATQVLVLQHPNERKRKTISTVPLLPLTLANVVVKVGYSFDAAALAPLRDAEAKNRQPLLLFPGPNAVLLDSTSTEHQATCSQASTGALSLQAKDKPALLILIDGTWSEARAMARSSPSLFDTCTQVAFSGESEALYGSVRREPSAECVSTLEATCRCLRHLEPESTAVHAATRHLEDSMRGLVQKQLECQAGHRGVSRRRLSSKARR